MNDNERRALRRGAAIQIAAALAQQSANSGEDANELGVSSVEAACSVIDALAAFESAEDKDRAALKATDAALHAIAAVGFFPIEPK